MDPAHRDALLAAAGAADESRRAGFLSDEGLKAVVGAATHRSRAVWPIGTDILGSLVCRCPNAARALVEMARDSRAHVRHQAVATLRGDTPLELVIPMLRSGLRDRSGSVRSRAAQIAETLDRRELLPDLQEALEAERDPKTRASLELHLLMLRDGAMAEPQGEGQVSLWVKVPGYGYSGRSVSVEEFREKGLPALAAEIRASRR